MRLTFSFNEPCSVVIAGRLNALTPTVVKLRPKSEQAGRSCVTLEINLE